MSANIRWEPKINKKKTLGVSSPNSFWESMERAFDVHGCHEIELGPSDLSTLNGMASVSGDDNPYSQLIKLIEKYDVILISKEY